jgi:PAS domain-containing protein
MPFGGSVAVLGRPSIRFRLLEGRARSFGFARVSLVPLALTRMWQTLAPPRQERYIIEQAFSEMHPSEAQLRIMIDTVPALAWSCLPDGANEFTNKRWRDYTGLSPKGQEPLHIARAVIDRGLGQSALSAQIGLIFLTQTVQCG